MEGDPNLGETCSPSQPPSSPSLLQSEGHKEIEVIEQSPVSLPAPHSPSPDPPSEGGTVGDGGTDERDGNIGPVEVGGEVVSPARFSFSAPMDNIVVRSFQFPTT